MDRVGGFDGGVVDGGPFGLQEGERTRRHGYPFRSR
jgi:hypothetical protein